MSAPNVVQQPAQRTARVDEQACDLCAACLAVCPVEAIKLGEDAVEIDAQACYGCGACVEACPNNAIKLT